MTDALLSEYGWSLEYVLWQLPLQQALALYAAIAARYGNEQHGPNYEEMDLLDELTAGGDRRARRRPRRKKRR